MTGPDGPADDDGPPPAGGDPGAADGQGTGPEDDAAPELGALDQVRDAGIGISRVGPRKPDTLDARERRNKRERANRARDKATGVHSEHKSVSDVQKLLAVAEDPHTYELAGRLPQPATDSPGRRRCYPRGRGC